MRKISILQGRLVIHYCSYESIHLLAIYSNTYAILIEFLDSFFFFRSVDVDFFTWTSCKTRYPFSCLKLNKVEFYCEDIWEGRFLYAIDVYWCKKWFLKLVSLDSIQLLRAAVLHSVVAGVGLLATYWNLLCFLYTVHF